MYTYVTKADTKPFRHYCQEVLAQLQKALRGKYAITVQFSLAGSGARNMVTRNGKGPFDLDYDLMLLSIPKEYEASPGKLKEVIRITLDSLIREKCICEQYSLLGDKFSYGQDSTSSITYLIHSQDGKKVEFYFDVAIIRQKKESGEIYRLIHDKKKEVAIWNQMPALKNLEFQESVIKRAGCWGEVKNVYLAKKNMYLERQDKHHPSYIVYEEAVHQVYQSIKVK